MRLPFRRSRIPGTLPLALQCVAGVGAMLTVAALGTGPDATLLIPLAPGARAALPALALDGRTALLGTGLLPGSLLVRREAGTHTALLRSGILAIAVPARLCTGAATS